MSSAAALIGALRVNGLGKTAISVSAIPLIKPSLVFCPSVIMSQHHGGGGGGRKESREGLYCFSCRSFWIGVGVHVGIASCLLSIS